MSLAEFAIRKIGYQRKDQNNWAKFRRVAFAFISVMGGKGAPKSERAYFSLPLVDGKQEVSHAQVAAYTEAVKKYNALKRVQNG